MAKTFTRYKDTPKYITGLSRLNRLGPTPQEEKLWLRLSSNKLNGVKFRRQFPIGRYIADFYNHKNKLIIEVDGGIHKSMQEYDKNRGAYLAGCGYKVLHFSNDEIENDIESVLGKIVQHIESFPV